MEDSIIISRAILGMVCVINIFIGYASTRGFVKKAISKKKLKIYLMKRVGMISFTDQEFVEGEIDDGRKKIRVLLDNTLTKAEVPCTCEVKFEVVENNYIIVRLAKED